MKKLILPILSAFLFSFSYSQDKIVMNSGEVLYGKVEEVNVTEVKYKKQDNLTGPVYTVNKTDVYSIHYENGTKDVFAAKEEKKNDDYVKKDEKKNSGDNDDVYGGNENRKDHKKKNKNYDRDRVQVVVPIWNVVGWLFFFSFLGCF